MPRLKVLFAKLHRQVLLAFLLVMSCAFVNGQTATLESVFLSDGSVPSWCPLPREIPGSMCGKSETRVEVNSVVKNPKNEHINFVYVVSGGEIVGSGAQVVWDLHKAQPGKHSITVGLGDGGIVRGPTITKPLTIETCPHCDLPCECPSLSVRGPERIVTAGDAFIVVADLQGGDYEKPAKMIWATGTNAKIIEGQGTLQALVRTNSTSRSGQLDVTFEINAVGLCPACARTASVSVQVVAAKPLSK